MKKLRWQILDFTRAFANGIDRLFSRMSIQFESQHPYRSMMALNEGSCKSSIAVGRFSGW
jgi:hypothetical protein